MLFDIGNRGYINREEFVKEFGRRLSNIVEDNINVVFKIYDFDNDGLSSSEDIRILLSYVTLKEILEDEKANQKKEGIFTTNGGGL